MMQEAASSTLVALLMLLSAGVFTGSTLCVPLPCPDLPERLLQAIAALEVRPAWQ
jgi:hypothetical protein